MERQTSLHNARTELRKAIQSLAQANGNNTHAILNSDDFTRACRAACRCPKAAAHPSFVAWLKRVISSHVASASNLPPAFVALDIMTALSEVLDTELVLAPGQERHTSFDSDVGIDHHTDHDSLTSIPRAGVRHTPMRLDSQQAASGGKNASAPVGPTEAVPLPCKVPAADQHGQATVEEEDSSGQPASAAAVATQARRTT